MLLNAAVGLSHTRFGPALSLPTLLFFLPTALLWVVLNVILVGGWFALRLRASARRRWLFRMVMLAACLIPILGAELYLRRSERYANYSELNGQGYVSPYDHRLRVPWLHVLAPNADTEMEASEFTHEVRTNGEGLRDVQHPVEKPAGELRIVALGDSFTMGVGVTFEETWLQVLQRRLNVGRPGRYRVICGGVGGSDPVYEDQLLRRRLLRYSPDLVLLVVNVSDVKDLVVRGGMDRFDADGFVAPQAPRVEFLFRSSHLARAVMLGMFSYDWDLLRGDERSEKKAKAFAIIVKIARGLKELGRERRFKLLVVAHPTYPELERPPPGVMHQLAVPLAASSVPFLDLFEHFRARIPRGRVLEFFHKRDQHCNAAGYRIFAEGVEQRVRALLP